jgi:hypothetical protein
LSVELVLGRFLRSFHRIDKLYDHLNMSGIITSLVISIIMTGRNRKDDYAANESEKKKRTMLHSNNNKRIVKRKRGKSQDSRWVESTEEKTREISKSTHDVSRY